MMRKSKSAAALLLALLLLCMTALPAAAATTRWQRSQKPNAQAGKVELYPYRIYQDGNTLSIDMYLVNGKDRPITDIQLNNVQVVCDGYVLANGSRELDGTLKAGTRLLFRMDFPNTSGGNVRGSSRVTCSAEIRYHYAN